MIINKNVTNFIGNLQNEEQHYITLAFTRLNNNLKVDFSTPETFFTSIFLLDYDSLDCHNKLLIASISSFYLPFATPGKNTEIISRIQDVLCYMSTEYGVKDKNQKDFLLNLEEYALAAITARQLFSLTEDSHFRFIDNYNSILYNTKKLLIMSAINLRDRALGVEDCKHVSIAFECAFDTLVIFWKKSHDNPDADLINLGFSRVIALSLNYLSIKKKALDFMVENKTINLGMINSIINLINPESVLSITQPTPSQASLILYIFTIKIEMSQEIDIKVILLNLLYSLVKQCNEIRECIINENTYQLLAKNFFLRTESNYVYFYLRPRIILDFTSRGKTIRTERLGNESTGARKGEVAINKSSINDRCNQIMPSYSDAIRVFALYLGESLDDISTHRYQQYALFSILILSICAPSHAKELVDSHYFFYTINFVKRSYWLQSSIELERTQNYREFFHVFYKLYFEQEVEERSLLDWYHLLNATSPMNRFAYAYIASTEEKIIEKESLWHANIIFEQVNIINYWISELATASPSHKRHALLTMSCSLFNLERLAGQRRRSEMANFLSKVEILKLLSSFPTENEKLCDYLEMRIIHSILKIMLAENHPYYRLKRTSLTSSSDIPLPDITSLLAPHHNVNDFIASIGTLLFLTNHCQIAPQAMLELEPKLMPILQIVLKNQYQRMAKLSILCQRLIEELVKTLINPYSPVLALMNVQDENNLLELADKFPSLSPPEKRAMLGLLTIYLDNTAAPFELVTKLEEHLKNWSDNDSEIPDVVQMARYLLKHIAVEWYKPSLTSSFGFYSAATHALGQVLHPEPSDLSAASGI